MNLIIFIATLALSLTLAPGLIRLAAHFGISRHRKSGRLRRRAVTVNGGVVIYLSFLLVTAGAFLLSREKWLGSYDYPYLGIVLSGGLMLILGLGHARRPLPFWIVIPVQVLAALILIGCGYRVDVVTFLPGGMLPLGMAGPVLLILWVVGLTNAFSLIDKIDGLAVGTAAISAITLFFARLSGPPFVPVITLALAGSCAGFLRYNFYPARIRLGSAGAFCLGFILAAAAAQGSLKATAGIALLFPILALLATIFHAARGLFRRKEIPPRPYQLHDRLLRLGYSPRQTILILYLLQANLGMIALVAAAAGKILALGIFFLVGTMLYILFTIVEEYRSRILFLEKAEAEMAEGETP